MTEREQILNWPEVAARTSLSRSTARRYCMDGLFPMPLKLGVGRRIGWRETDIAAWIKSRVAA